jgi:small subunit ribosomal protein S2
MENYLNFTLKDMIDAGAHFGHSTNRWNPKMAPYIYGSKSGYHVINLSKSFLLFQQTLAYLAEAAKLNKKILFTCTKKQGTEVTKYYAEECKQYYVNFRWLGGMLTNWSTISNSIKKLDDLELTIKETELNSTHTKKEKLNLNRKYNKLHSVLSGIRNISSLPDILFVIDTKREEIAIKEANKLGITVIAIADTNSNTEGIDFIIPGNDDSRSSINFFLKYTSMAINHGKSQTTTTKDETTTKEKNVKPLPNKKNKNLSTVKSNIDKSANTNSGDKTPETLMSTKQKEKDTKSIKQNISQTIKKSEEKQTKDTKKKLSE